MNKIDIVKMGQEMVTLGTYEDYEIEDIVLVLQHADDLYYNDQESFLEDPEYDALRRYAERLEPHHPYFTGVGSEVRGGKVKLPYKMGSLDQKYEGEIAGWVLRHNLQQQYVTVTDKLDGTSAMVIYDKSGDLQIAYSRGDGIEGADITRHIKNFKCVPLNAGKSMVIRGEVIFSHDGFKKVQEKVMSRSGRPYKNARNMTAGLMNAKSHESYVQLIFSTIRFVAYEIVGCDDLDKISMLQELERIGFEVPHHQSFVGSELTDEMLASYLTTRRDETQYEIDGLVLDVNDATKRAQMNPTRDTLNPVYAVKYKIADASNQAVVAVTKVQWRPSKHGYWKPRVHIEPVDLVGVTIKHATGFNAKFIFDNKVGPGAKVRITRSGDVIPFIQDVVEPADAPQMPGNEGKDWEWNDTGVDAVMVEHNDEVTINRITDFFATIDAPMLKKGNVIKLFEGGFTTIESIIKLPEQALVNVLGENGRKVYDGLRAKLNNIQLHTLLGAHAADRGIGVRKMKKLHQAFGSDKLLECPTVEEIISRDGFEYKTAQKVVRCITKFNVFVSEIQDYVTFAAETATAGGAMEGQKVVFTGFRDKELAARVEAEGGEMQSAVSGKTTILVSSEPDSNSGKMKKARELGVRVLGVEDFKELLG